MLSELHSLNLLLYIKQYDKNFVLHLIVVHSSAVAGDRSTQPNKAGRLCQWAVFSYVYAKGPNQALLCSCQLHFLPKENVPNFTNVIVLIDGCCDTILGEMVNLQKVNWPKSQLAKKVNSLKTPNIAFWLFYA